MNKLQTILNRRRFVASALAALGAVPATAAGGDVAIVVRQDTPVDSLTLGDLRRVFLGDRQFWSSNLRVTLLVRAPGAHEREVVLTTIYQMSEAQYRQYWIAKVFRAEASSAPKVVYSNEMALELASTMPGALAFVDAAQVPKSLKVVKINGVLPGDSKYPLR
jgi:ABC-type phosphate transport system substrate-binding protein